MANNGNSKDNECRVCGKSKFSVWGNKDNLTLYRCDNCELVFFLPYPTQEQLDDFYNNHYHDVRGYDGGTKAGELREKMYKLDIAELESTIPVGGKFLDVGCAEGIFLTYLDPKWEKYGVDVSRESAQRASEKPGVIEASSKDVSELEDNFYDVIHLRGVFEHILFPNDFFKDAVRKLKKGGHLIISTTPNAEGPIVKLFRGRYKLILPNEHVNYFSPTSITVLAKNHNLSVARITFPYFGTPYESFLKDLINVPINYLSGKQSPPFWKNIFTAYLKKK